jgi:hypothetical protein
MTKIVETRIQDGAEIYFVKEFYDESDKITDSIVQTKGGYIIDDPAEVERILEFIDSL